MPIPTLILPPELTVTKSVRFQTKETQLGDGYYQTSAVGVTDGVEEWSVSSDWLWEADAANLVNQLEFLRGATPFAWTPDGASGGKVYTCEKFEVKPQQQLRQIQATFVEYLQGECEPYRDTITPEDEILALINGLKLHIATYTRSQSPMLVTGSYVTVNSFHSVLGRGGYFPASAATSEGQAIGIRAAANAFIATGDEYWRQLAIGLANAYSSLFYPTTFPPADLTTLNANNVIVAHWLLNAKEPFVSKAPVATDPLAYGYFDLVVTFVNGVGQIPAGAPTYGEKLADVYSVIPLDAELLWRNVFALPRGNPNNVYEIDYWVSDLQLKGNVRRIFPDSKTNSGRESEPTIEPVGKLKLVQAFNGQAKVAFSTYTGAVIGVNQGFEAYPMWRALRPTESYCATDTIPWTWDGYRRLFEITGNPKWLQCQLATQITEYFCAKINNPTAWYKKEPSNEPFRYPGSQAILVNNDNPYTASRVVGGDKDQWLRLDVPTSNKLYPQIQIQNYAVQAIITSDVTVHVEVATSVATVIDVILSLSSDPFDFTKYYYAKVPTPGAGTPIIQNFTYKDFLNWDLKKTVWYADLADNPIYTYHGDNGEATATRVNELIDGTNRYVWKLALKGGGDYAGGGFVYLDNSGQTLGAKPRFPLKFFYRHNQITDGGTVGGAGYVTLNLKYGTDVYNTQVFDTNGAWLLKTLDAQDFVYVNPVFGGGVDLERHPTEGIVPDAIYIESLPLARSETSIFWVGDAPNILPSYVQTYKALLASKVTTAHTFWIGDFAALNSPSSELRYNPGVPAFTANTLNFLVDSWQGNNEAGYVYPEYFVEIGDYGRLQQCLDYLSDSQDAYAAQNINNTIGPFCPSFNWPIWFSYTGLPINQWVYFGVDPNVAWEGYQARPFGAVSHAWYLLTQQGLGRSSQGQQAGRIAMKFCGWLYGFYRNRNSNQPPTNFPAQLDPQVLYHTPHFAAFALRAAIYCNLSGGNSLITYGIIKASYEYLKSQYVSSGTMTGSFTASQPTFTENGTQYRQNFFFWSGEVLDSLVLLLQHRTEIRLPSCSSPLI